MLQYEIASPDTSIKTRSSEGLAVGIGLSLLCIHVVRGRPALPSGQAGAERQGNVGEGNLPTGKILPVK